MRKFDEKKVLTFDCYGTLIDWETGILNDLRPLLQKYEVVLTDKQILESYASIESELENGSYKAYREILTDVVLIFGKRFGFTPDTDDEQALVNGIREWPVFPDTVMALRQLVTKFKAGVISNIDDDLFPYSQQKLQVSFDWIITAQQVRAYKPDEEVFRFALDKIAAESYEIIHVAQSLYHDIAPAQEMGLSTIWVNRRKGHEGAGATPEALAKPDLEVPDLKALAEALLS